MRASPLLLATLLGLSGTLAAEKAAEKKDAPASKKQTQTKPSQKAGKPIQSMFIGENESYKHPDSTASDAMETISRQQGGKGTFGEVDIGGTTNPKEPRPQQGESQVAADPTQGLSPNDAVPREILGLPPKTHSGASAVAGVAGDAKPTIKVEAAAPPSSEERAAEAQDRKRYSLWEGLAAPLAMPGGQVSKVSLDDASALGRKDYDAHILGVRRRPDDESEVKAARASAELAMGDHDPEETPEVFVNFDLNLSSDSPEDKLLASATLRPGPEETLRDALAALSSVAGFRPDARFNALPSKTGKISLSGWMAADRIQAAMQVPSVSRMEIKNSLSARSASVGSTSDVLVGIRIPGIDPSKGIPRESEAEVNRHYNSVLARLSSHAGFMIKRTIGYQTAPGGQDIVIVAEGRVPIRNLSRLMSHRDVVKVAPAPPAGAPVAVGKRSARGGFLAFVAARAPVLIGVTVLLLIPAIGSWFLKFVETLVPYNRD